MAPADRADPDAHAAAGAPAAQVADGPHVALAATVQHNCDLADALHAREQGLCTYLLAMRELYRWHVAAPLGTPLPRAAVGAWIAARERHWEQLLDAAAAAGADAAFAPLPLGGGIDPFDEAAVNAQLATLPGVPLVYGAGLGRQRAPLFFLAELAQSRCEHGVAVTEAGRELARGMAAPPAASRDGRVILRRDALRRWLWTRLEGAQPRGAHDGFGALLRQLDAADAAAAIEQLASTQGATLVLHELGELQAGAQLGPDWDAMLLQADRRTELVLRALRDLLADALVTLPALLARGDSLALAFWSANLEGLRQRLASGLGADAKQLADALPAALARWQQAALALRAAWRDGGAAALAQAADRLAS